MSVDVCPPRALKKDFDECNKTFRRSKEKNSTFLTSPKGNRHREKVYLE